MHLNECDTGKLHNAPHVGNVSCCVYDKLSKREIERVIVGWGDEHKNLPHYAVVNSIRIEIYFTAASRASPCESTAVVRPIEHDKISLSNRRESKRDAAMIKAVVTCKLRLETDAVSVMSSCVN